MRLRRSRTAADGSRVRLALDIGTEYVKAVVVAVDDPHPRVLGVGRVRQRAGDMEGGAVSRIAGVVERCEEAIEEACTMAGAWPVESVVGVAGEFVEGCVTTIQMRRPRPERPLRPAEWHRLLAAAKEQAAEEAQRILAARTGLEDVDVELVDTAVVECRIDGYRVTSPLDFQGGHVELRLFSTFSPLVHIGALRTVNERLGLRLRAAVAEPYAVATGALREEAAAAGAVVLDIGGGSTDVAVVRDRAVIATKSFPIGGRSFTRSLALHLQIDLDEAEALKLDFAAGLLDEAVRSEVEEVVRRDLEILREGLRLTFQDLSAVEPLPERLFLCGGGSALPGLAEMCSTTEWGEGVFRRAPQVRRLTVDDVRGVADPAAFLAGERDVTPKSLARQTVVHGEDELQPFAAMP